MRKINTADVFKFARIIKETKMQCTIRDAYIAGKKEDANQEEIGLNTMLEIICACADTKIESKIYDLLAGILEKTEDMIKNQSMETTISDIEHIFLENEIGNFLKSAFRLSESIND